MEGASSAYTDAGPPDRMMAAGAMARTSSAVMSQGTISEYTCKSRTRPGDELPVLGAEIDDDNLLFRGSGLGHNASLDREMFEGDFTPPRAQRYFCEVKCRESAEWVVGRRNYRRYFARRAWRFSGPKSRASVR